MLWYLILGSVFCTCALASYYAPDNDEQAEQAYEMQKLLDIENFFDVQSNLDKITRALNEKTGLEHKADIAAQLLDNISPQIYYLLQIIEDLANPCSDGIYRNGKCANYIPKSKFNGTEVEARNLCLAHFGVFSVEEIIDYSYGPYGDNEGGYYGGGYYGDTTNGGGYGGDAPNGGDYNGDTTNGGGYYGDTTNGGGYYGDTTNSGGYYGSGIYGDAPPSNGGGYYSGDAPPPSGGGYYGGDAPPPSGGGGNAPPPSGAGYLMPPPGTGDGDYQLPIAVTYYICYERPVVNIPKSIYFPSEIEEEEDEDEESNPEQYPNPNNEKWFSGKIDPENDEDECPYSALGGAVIGDMCYNVYDGPKNWTEANNSCIAYGGKLCEPHATRAESAVFYSLLKAKLGAAMARIESAATPNPSNPGTAQLWLGWKQVTAGANLFLSQISSPSVPNTNPIFVPSVTSSSTPAFAAAITQPGTSWEGKNPAKKIPYCCQYHLV